MSSARHPERVFIDPSDLEAVAASLCSRFGDPAAEAYRRSTLHDVLKSVRSLAAALEAFARAGARTIGVCTSPPTCTPRSSICRVT